MIQLNLHKTLSSTGGKMALDLDLTIEKGHFVTLFGESGAGKTSTFTRSGSFIGQIKFKLCSNLKNPAQVQLPIVNLLCR